MWMAFKLEAVGNLDYSLMLDDNDNTHNIVGAAVFEKFDFISMRKHILSKTESLNKCQSKLVLKYGQYWYQKMDKQEF